MIKSDVPGANTMMRKTPVASDNVPTQEMISDDQKFTSGQFEATINHMYNTGGPGIFGNEGLDLDNIDPQMFKHDLKIESKLIVADLCLNSTNQSQVHQYDTE